MSLIIRNKLTLGDTAIIFIKHLTGEIKTNIVGDFTILKVNEDIVGINIFNSSNYLKFVDGAKTLSTEDVKTLEKELKINIEVTSSFKIGEITSRSPHPNSQNLFLLNVKTDKEIKIVTNAKNALVGKKVIVAQINSVLPSGIPIIKSKVLGCESEGMLCGGETLGLEKTEGVKLIEGNNGDEFIL